MPDFLYMVGPRRRALLFALAQSDGAAIAYKFDEAAGSFVNGIHPGAYDLTAVSGQITRRVAGKSGPDYAAAKGSLASGSAPDYGHAEGTHPSLSGNTAFSLECVLSADMAAGNVIFQMDAGNGLDSVSVANDASHVYGSLQIAGRAFSQQSFGAQGAGGLDLGAWHHYVMTWDGSAQKLYRDGALIVSAAPGTGGIYSPAGTVTAVFGASHIYDATNRNTDATLDFLAVYTTVVLSQTQITAHYAAANVP